MATYSVGNWVWVGNYLGIVDRATATRILVRFPKAWEFDGKVNAHQNTFAPDAPVWRSPRSVRRFGAGNEKHVGTRVPNEVKS